MWGLKGYELDSSDCDSAEGTDCIWMVHAPPLTPPTLGSMLPVADPVAVVGVSSGISAAYQWGGLKVMKEGILGILCMYEFECWIECAQGCVRGRGGADVLPGNDPTAALLSHPAIVERLAFPSRRAMHEHAHAAWQYKQTK